VYVFDAVTCRDFGAVTQTFRHCVSVGADNVDSSKLVVEVLNESLGTVKLRWEEPPSPNGIIVTYQIEYKSVENPNVSWCL
jgi:insulin receptor